MRWTWMIVAASLAGAAGCGGVVSPRLETAILRTQPVLPPSGDTLSVAVFVALRGTGWTEPARKQATARLYGALARHERFSLFPPRVLAQRLATAGDGSVDVPDRMTPAWIARVREKLGTALPDVLLEVRLYRGRAWQRDVLTGKLVERPRLTIEAVYTQSTRFRTYANRVHGERPTGELLDRIVREFQTAVLTTVVPQQVARPSR